MNVGDVARSISRRTVLSGCGAMSVLAALADARRVHAAPTGYPQRLLIWVRQEGNVSDLWRLPTVAADGTFSIPSTHVLAPLEPFKSRMLIVEGMVAQANIDCGVDTAFVHKTAVSGLLTGNPANYEVPLDNNGENAEALSASIDQVLAEPLRGPAKYPSLLYSVTTNRHPGTVSLVSYAGAGPALPAMVSPELTFDRLFPPPDPGTAAAARTQARRASVAKLVSGQLGVLRQRLPREDANKVEAHLSALSDIQKQFPPPSASCVPPSRPAAAYASDSTQSLVATRAQIQLLVRALECDLTRVSLFGLCDSNWNVAMPLLGLTERVHTLSHGLSPEAAAAGITWENFSPKIIRWSVEQLAYLLSEMQNVREGEGTLLDHTLILVVSEWGDSHNHSFAEMPFMLIGGAGGYFKQGQVVRVPGAAHNNLLVSVANALGLPVRTFGNADPRYYSAAAQAALRA